MRAVLLTGLLHPSLAGKCCYSNFGDASSCGGYPTGASSGLCNADYSTPCGGDADCDAAPTPAPTPPAPTPPAPTPAPTPPAPTPAPSGNARCCWSAWGDASTCGSYPSGGSGGLCTTDWSKSCSAVGDCPATPAPTPPPPTPTPVGPVPPPTPPVPTPPPTPVPTPPPTPRGPRGVELLGYLENWGPSIKWWDENMPGHCLMGCFKEPELLNIMKSYSALNYGFSFFTKNPDPDQDGCTGFSPDKTTPPAGPCPEWDGENIYLAKSGKQDSIAINSGTTIEKPTSSIIAITEAVRMGRMHPDGPKRVKIVLGGWSDYARIGAVENGIKAAKLYGKFVAHTFADGVDIDMEHLTPYDRAGDEFNGLIAFINQLRTELDDVVTNWAANAQAKKAAMQQEYNGLEDWKKKNVQQYYQTSFNYLDEVAANPVPYLEISWTTRFNAFLPEDNVWNYLYPESEVPEKNYETDNEGLKLWPGAGKNIDTVNIMAYDAGGILINMETVLKNFVAYSGDPSIAAKINIGFEPGEQAAGGVWEGLDADKKFAQFALDNGYGGAMVWAANPNPVQAPTGSKLCPETAAALNELLQPQYAWGAATWTKCTSSGWWPGVAEEMTV